MSQTREGALRRAAKKLNISYEEYLARNQIEKRCATCESWKRRTEFCLDRTRHDGLDAHCRTCKAVRKASYPKRPRKVMGPAPHAPRDGDKRQARKRVNVLVRTGRLPKPSTLPCVDCGDRDGWHEYDHYKGYGADNHLTVEVVCSKCHKARERERRKR